MKLFRISYYETQLYADKGYERWFKGPVEVIVDEYGTHYKLTLRESLYVETYEDAVYFAKLHSASPKDIKVIEFSEDFLDFAAREKRIHFSFGEFAFESRKLHKQSVLSKLTDKYEKEYIRYIFQL